MNTITKQVLYWSPRVLSILFTLFLSIFALDVFGEGYGFVDTILALLMHLIPTALITAVIVIAWRWERVGEILFIALALFYLVMSRGERWIISVPVLLIGILCLSNWIYRSRLQIK